MKNLRLKYQLAPALAILALAGCMLIRQIWHFGSTFSDKSSVTRRERMYRATTGERYKQPVTFFNSQTKLESGSPYIRVEEGDYIYSSRLGAAPIVVESHKLIFFYVPKVSCTVWKKLFRRIKGFSDWDTKSPHNSATNGLTYFNSLNRTYATEIMNDPSWTRAMIVRDPKERFLSAYLDKARHDNATYVVGACCKKKHNCWAEAQTFQGFFNLTRRCMDTHWRPQSKRMDGKFLPLVDYVGHMDSIAADARYLLTKIGAWDEYGALGWGADGSESMYESKSSVKHATSTGQGDSWGRLARHYTPELEMAVEKRYSRDYDLPLFQLQRRKIDFP